MGIWLRTRNAGLFMFTLKGRRGISPDGLPFPVLNFHPSKHACVCAHSPLRPSQRSFFVFVSELTLRVQQLQQLSSDTFMQYVHLFLSPSHSAGFTLIVTSFLFFFCFLPEGRVHLCIGLLIRATPKHLRCLCRGFDDGCPPEIRERVNDLIINDAYRVRA